MEAMDTYDEPMDVDTSQFLAPSTPLPNGNQNDISMNGSPRSAQKSAKAVKNGPKLVKAIRPNGGSPPNSIGKSAGRRPQTGAEIEDGFNRDHYNNGSSDGGTTAFEVSSSSSGGANPFQTKKALARTPSPTSSNARHFDDFPVRGSEPAEKLVASDTEGHDAKNQAEKPCENETDQLAYFNNRNGGSVDAADSSSNNMLNDEWETHKKRATTAQNVNISIPPYEYQPGDATAWHNQEPKPVSSNSCSSNVSSTTDISSSVSPNPIANEHDVDSAVCQQQQQQQQMSALQERASSQSQLTSSSAASLSSAASVNNEPVPSSTNEEAQHNHAATTTQNVNSMNDDLTNVTNTNSNMDTLTPENETTEMVKSPQEIGGQSEAASSESGLDPFKTPPPLETSAQNKRLNFVNSRASNNSTSFEAAQSTLVDFETSAQDETQQQLAGTNQPGESVLFDSIFSNDTDFQSFLDLLEKKEGDTANKTSPKFSEFARKSLYLQFDPIIQSRSLSPEKIRRLSVIRDKQEQIKSFLSGAELESTKSQPKTLVEIEEEPETETVETSVINKPASAASVDKKASASANVAKKSVNDFIVEIKEPAKKFNVKTEPPMESLVSSTASFNNELEREGMFDKSNEDGGASDAGSDLGAVQQPFMKRSGLQRSNENVNSIARQNGTPAAAASTSDLTNGGHQDDQLTKSITTNGHHHHHLDEATKADEVSKGSNFDDQDVDDASVASVDEQATKPPSGNAHLTNGNESVKNKDLITSVDGDDVKALLINNAKQAVGARPNLSSSKRTNGSTSSAASATNKLAFAGAGIANADEKGQLEELRERERAHLERISLLEDENEKFKTVAIEFERIFHNLIKDKEEGESKLKAEIIELTKERDHLQEDVVGVERAFDDLHRRFEKLKTKVEEFKKNEETLQNALETYKQQLEKEKLKYSTLKKHAEEKIDVANSEIEKLRKGTSIEIQTLKAELRKAEIKISSLELSVQQKDQENTQLTNLLEDLLSKVKPNA